MHRTERHDLYVANGSGGTRSEVRVTSINGSFTSVSSTSDTQDPKKGVSKLAVRKVAYRRKAPITLGSVKDWPIDAPSQPEDESQYGRIDLSKMTIESSSSSRTKVHKINVETSSNERVENKSPIFKGITVKTSPAQDRQKLLSSSKTSPSSRLSPTKESSQPSPVKETRNVPSINLVPSESSSISTKIPADVHDSSTSKAKEEPKASFGTSGKSEIPSTHTTTALESPRTTKTSADSSKPATSSNTPANSNTSQSPIPSKEMPKPHGFIKDPPKSSNIIKESQTSPASTKASSKGSLSPSREMPAVRDKKAPSSLTHTQNETSKPPSSSRGHPSPSKDEPSTSRLSDSHSLKANDPASIKQTCTIGGSANTSKIPDGAGSPKEPALRKPAHTKPPKISYHADTSEPEFKPRNVVIKENKPVKQWYSVDETLGSGKFGVVRLGRDNETGMKCAIKFIPIGSEEERESVLTEIKVMVKLQHPRLIQLLDAFMSKDEAALVMEVISGGELFERIIDDNFELTESKCVQFMREVCDGVKFIHDQHVIHLDLKPENILCLNRTGFKIKIIDFGLARFWRFGESLRVMFGTPEFVAPEILAYDEVSHLTDMWSVGVICYVLLSGLSPFMGDSDRETYINITKAKFSFNYPEFKEISNDAKNFVSKLLVKEMRHRMTAEEALNHKWLQRRTSLIRTGTVSKRALRRFVYRRKWQKAKNIIVALLRMGVTLTQR